MKKTARTFTAEQLKQVVTIIETKLQETSAAEAAPRVKVAAGNSKLGAIPAFNLPPIVTCGYCAACMRNCYACKDYLNYRVRSVSVNHARNLAALLQDPERAYSDLDNYLTKHRPAFFRIHSSGDFNVTIDDKPYKYAMMWFLLAKSHPDTHFLAFTKCYDIARKIPFDSVENFSLILSEWTDVLRVPEDLKRRYATSRAVNDLSDVRPNELACPGSCSACGMCWGLKSTGRNVAFEIH